MDIRWARIALLLVLLSGFAGICASTEFDISYTPLQNGGAEEGMSGWFSAVGNSVPTDCPQGSRCFKVSSAADSPGELRSSLISVRKGEALLLEYSLKIGSDIVIKEGGLYVSVRSFGSDKTAILGENRFDIDRTQGKWIHYKHQLTVDAKAYYADIRFVINDVQAGDIYIDAVAVFREIRYNPLYADIKPLSENDSLYVFTKGRHSEDNQSIAIQTLQGVVARTDRPRIWVDAGDNTFMDCLAANYKLRFDRKYAGDWAGLLSELKPYTSGTYVLYDIQDKPSITAAVTMAGLLDAVAMDVRLEAEAIAKGYTRAMDVRGKDCRWVYENYRDQLSHEAIIVHTNEGPIASFLKDWSPVVKGLCWWLNDKTYSGEVYQSMAPCTPVYGWHDPTTSDEGLSVKMHSEGGLFQIPSDWMLNLSVHASMGRVLKDKKFTQKVSRPKPVKETGVHYVTFILSDMDNILTEIGTNSFYSNPRFYQNSHRGQFPMSWGMAPSLVELSPAGLELWYDHATPKDVFVGYCGLGYFYPSEAPYMQTHAKRLAEFLDRADLRTLLLIDRLLPEKKLTQDYYDKIKWFTSIEKIRGLFYLEYIQYAPHNGKIFWFDGKPMVTARFDLRDEKFYPAVRSTGASLADSINKLPKDPTSPDGYTFVTVHAWSRGLDDIHETILHLDPNVRVVNAEEFIEQIRQNVKPSN